MKYTIWAAALCLAAATPATAKPLSYVGGTMLMQENDVGGHTLAVDHTLSRQMAAALHIQRHTRGENFTMLGPQLNVLLQRWNLPDGQGNVFATLGGGTTIERGEMRPAVWSGFLADYETRRVFVSYDLRLTYAKRIQRSAWQRVRVGTTFNPVTYDTTSLWLMLQVDRRDEKHFGGHHGSIGPKTDVTPILRAMYKTFMMEGGVSVDGKVMFNWIQQF